jgi:tRNA-dihydrouridine synthase
MTAGKSWMPWAINRSATQTMSDIKSATDQKTCNQSQRPWRDGEPPLMLAPMQGLTNRAMRALFIDWVRPDVVFTEFMRVSNVSRKRLIRNDLTEAGSATGGVPLVAQLVGNDVQALIAAARNAEAAGAQHINLNMGCPYGRMTTSATGGAMLQHPEQLQAMIPALRQAISGSFSIKMRAGYNDPEQVFSLVSLFEDSSVDFLVLHPRTVVQKYAGSADHSITARLVSRTSIPVIANGDIRSAQMALQVLETTGAAGLMLGRGAIADPLLFTRIRHRKLTEPVPAETALMIRRYMAAVVERYRELFCGERQVLDKAKNVLAFLDQPEFARPIGKLKRAGSLAAFSDLLEQVEPS